MTLVGDPGAAHTDTMSKVRRMTKVAALLGALYCVRRYYRNWGSTKAESQMRLPGDALVGDPVIQVTEAVYIDALVSAVWPHVQQHPLGSAGDAGASHPGRQLAVGDELRLAPAGWMGLTRGVTLTVEEIMPGEYIVLQAKQLHPSWHAVLSFHLQPHWDDRVRLLVRARIALRHPGEVFAMELARPLISLGTRGWLLGTKRRAERVTSVPITEARSASESY